LNARMSEFHAAVALASLEGLDTRIDRRNELVRLYKQDLAMIPGVSFPLVRDEDRSTYKDFTILIDDGAFGCDATRLREALSQDGIDTRRYYAPPVHTMRAYNRINRPSGSLETTVKIASQVITLPLWIDMTDDMIHRIAESVGRIQAWHGRVDRPREIDLREPAESHQAALH